MRRQVKAKKTKPTKTSARAQALDAEREQAAWEYRLGNVCHRVVLAAFTGLVDKHGPREAAQLAWQYADAFMDEDERRQREPIPDADGEPEPAP